MRRWSSAVVLFTLTPEAEGARKNLGLAGSGRAAALFAALIEHVETVCAGLTDADLLVASRSRVELPAGARWLHQRGRNFGESLRLAVEEAFALGYRRVVVLGNDAPEISRDYLETALDELSGNERQAVVGPATDGGYNLLGLTEPCSAAFEAMPWGSSHVAELTTERLRESGFQVAHLRALADIDDARALVRFLSRRRAGLERLIRRIRELSEPVCWAIEETPHHHEQLAIAGPPRLRAPPSLA
ncbi:MAG TPA: DUF2064 domain-containing protein [Vicinamibacteria bacterium]